MKVSVLFLILALAAAPVFANGGKAAQSAVPADIPFSLNRIYIANMTPPSLSFVDLDTFSAETGSVTTIYFSDIAKKDQSHLISVSKDGRYVWLSEDISKNGGYVQVVDAQTLKIVKKWEVGAGVGTHISHDGKWGFFSSEKTSNNNINVFDVQNQRYLGYIELGAEPHNYDTSYDGKYLYTANFPKNLLLEYDISVLDEIAKTATTDQYGVKLPITPRRTFDAGGNSSHGVLLHPNNKYLVVGSYTKKGNDGINPDQAFDTFVDLTTPQITAIKVIPGGNHNYEISPDRKYFLSSEWNAQDCNEQDYLKNLAAFGDAEITTPLLRFIDIETLDSDRPNFDLIKVVDYLDGADLGYSKLSPMSHEIYDPSGKYLFVTTIQLGDHNKGELVILDGKTREVVSVLSLPNHPHGLSLPAYGR